MKYSRGIETIGTEGGCIGGVGTTWGCIGGTGMTGGCAVRKIKPSIKELCKITKFYLIEFLMSKELISLTLTAQL